MKNEFIWNPWHGCKKYSEGCANCYVYRRDESVGRDASVVCRTQDFDMPLKTDRSGAYKIPSGAFVYACMTSDFFIDEADAWRPEIWEIIKKRSDVKFMIITKRILRFSECIPPDWGNGYENVAVVCTMENQKRCDERFPVFLKLPIAKKYVASEPLLEPIDMSRYLCSSIVQVTVGGESGYYARPCDYDWILDIRRQCRNAGVRFWFKQTGAYFIRDSKLYKIPRRLQHSQARRAMKDMD